MLEPEPFAAFFEEGLGAPEPLASFGAPEPEPFVVVAFFEEGLGALEPLASFGRAEGPSRFKRAGATEDVAAGDLGACKKSKSVSM